MLSSLRMFGRSSEIWIFSLRGFISGSKMPVISLIVMVLFPLVRVNLMFMYELLSICILLRDSIERSQFIFVFPLRISSLVLSVMVVCGLSFFICIVPIVMVLFWMLSWLSKWIS